MPFGEARGLECPACGVGQCRARKTARANEQTIFLRRRYCDNDECGFVGNTFESWFEGPDLAQFDEDIKYANMIRDRLSRGRPIPKIRMPTKPVARFGSINYTIGQPNREGQYRIITDTLRGIYLRLSSRQQRREYGPIRFRREEAA